MTIWGKEIYVLSVVSVNMTKAEMDRWHHDPAILWEGLTSWKSWRKNIFNSSCGFWIILVFVQCASKQRACWEFFVCIGFINLYFSTWLLKYWSEYENHLQRSAISHSWWLTGNRNQKKSVYFTLLLDFMLSFVDDLFSRCW